MALTDLQLVVSYVRYLGATAAPSEIERLATEKNLELSRGDLHALGVPDDKAKEGIYRSSFRSLVACLADRGLGVADAKRWALWEGRIYPNAKQPDAEMMADYIQFLGATAPRQTILDRIFNHEMLLDLKDLRALGVAPHRANEGAGRARSRRDWCMEIDDARRWARWEGKVFANASDRDIDLMVAYIQFLGATAPKEKIEEVVRHRELVLQWFDLDGLGLTKAKVREGMGRAGLLTGQYMTPDDVDEWASHEGRARAQAVLNPPVPMPVPLKPPEK
ncbi:MAG: hypothetical protein HY903_25345 [Deltaproteobacteria bacterium]|nr:hypothetical protein [Deltaproteobacteria bacterium]